MPHYCIVDVFCNQNWFLQASVENVGCNPRIVEVCWWPWLHLSINVSSPKFNQSSVESYGICSYVKSSDEISSYQTWSTIHAITVVNQYTDQISNQTITNRHYAKFHKYIFQCMFFLKHLQHSLRNCFYQMSMFSQSPQLNQYCYG